MTQRRRFSNGHGYVTDFIGDGKGGGTFHSHADVGELLEVNKRSYDGDRMARRKSDMREVANIPNLLFLKWLQEDGITMQALADPQEMNKFLRRKLNSNEYAHLRTGPEKL
jgi:hypothetical protein